MQVNICYLLPHLYHLIWKKNMAVNVTKSLKRVKTCMYINIFICIFFKIHFASMATSEHNSLWDLFRTGKLSAHGPLRMPHSQGIHYCIMTMTKYSNPIFAIVLQEEGQDDEENKNGNDTFHPTEFWERCMQRYQRGAYARLICYDCWNFHYMLVECGITRERGVLLGQTLPFSELQLQRIYCISFFICFIPTLHA